MKYSNRYLSNPVLNSGAGNVITSTLNNSSSSTQTTVGKIPISLKPTAELINKQSPVTYDSISPNQEIATSNEETRIFQQTKKEYQEFQKQNSKSFDLKEFYQKHKKPILITGGVVGSVILLKIIF